MTRECHFCHETSDNFQRCSGCSKVWYCSKEHQKYDWVAHIFDCNPQRPVTTADYLALAVHKNILPEHGQTCEDYGFTKVLTSENQSKLLGLYIGLIGRMEIKPKTLHQWRVKGTLVQEIKNTFNKLPETHRGGYYPWFLQHQYVLDGSEGPEEDIASDIRTRAWQFVGRPATDTKEQILATISTMPPYEQDCHSIYTLILSQFHPSPAFDLWIKFGFCACTSDEEEMGLGELYRRLIHKCTFDEFYKAYDSSTLAALFHSHGLMLVGGLMLDIPHITDVLAGTPRVNKSVWNLKQFVSGAEDGLQTIPSVTVDYGFMNCKTDDERKDLKDVYKQYFQHRDGDPIKLHEACIGGRLFQHVNGVFKLRKPKRFTRLMKNLYPLPL